MLFGAQVSSAGGLWKAIDRAADMGCDAVQVFTQSPRAWRPVNRTAADFERFRERAEQSPIAAVLCHALYLVNLASPDPSVHEKSVAALEATLETAIAIGAEGVVFHVGSHLGDGVDAGIARAVRPLRDLLERTGEGPWLCIENSAGQGGTMGRSLAEIAALVDALGHHPRIGACLDSCHLYASGIDVTDPEELDALVGELDASIGLERLRCLHVNDSQAPLGSNRDRHASIGQGLMGSRIGVFVAHPAFQHLPAILETPGADGHGTDAEEVRLVRELHAEAVGSRREG